MGRLFGRVSRRLAAPVLVGIVLMLGVCTASKDEGFAIYLTKGDISLGQMPALSHVDIAEQPIIAMNDVVTYDAKTHEMTLTAGAYERISRLEVPVRGKSFTVCVDRKPVYWGAFWTPVSSVSFGGVTILKPLGFQDAKVVKLELGYPSRSFYGGQDYGGEDPRLSEEVLKSLEQAGKLH